MNRMLVATGFFVSVVLLINGCCCPTHMYTPSCGSGCGLGCASGGCGEVYWGEWMSDPPAPCDPCDDCGNWTGGCGTGCGTGCGSCGSCGQCGSWLCNLFSPCPLLWGNRYAEAGPMGMPMVYDGGYEVYDDGAMVVSEGEEILAPQESTPAPAKQPTPAKRSEARQYIPRSATAGSGSPHYRTAGRTVVNRTHTMPGQSHNTSGMSFAMPNQTYTMRGQTYATQDEIGVTEDDSYTVQTQPFMMQGQTRSAATQAQRPKRQATYGTIR